MIEVRFSWQARGQQLLERRDVTFWGRDWYEADKMRGRESPWMIESEEGGRWLLFVYYFVRRRTCLMAAGPTLPTSGSLENTGKKLFGEFKVRPRVR